MTKETKIGLLVGLAFIILFAIILSEKGTNKDIKSPAGLTTADAGIKNKSVTGVERPLYDAGRLPIETDMPLASNTTGSGNSNVDVMIEEPVGKPIPTNDSSITPLPSSIVQNMNLPKVEDQVAIDDTVTTLAQGEPMSVNDAVTAALQPSGATPTQPRSTQFSSITPDMSSSGHTSESASRTKPVVPAPQTPAKPIKAMAVHTVKAGESLGKIAARYYGRSTPSRVQAIFNANRDKLDAIQSVRANTQLTIPQLEEEGLAFEPADRFSLGKVATNNRPTSPIDTVIRIPVPVEESSKKVVEAPKTLPTNDALVAVDTDTTPTKPGKSSTPTEAARKIKTRWYEVQSKDTLTRIARQQLGSERRYKEIYDLNHDVLTSKHVLKPGMKLRLPVDQGSGMSNVPALSSVVLDDVVE